MKQVKFILDPPSLYEDKGEIGDKLWEDLMPGKSFLSLLRNKHSS